MIDKGKNMNEKTEKMFNEINKQIKELEEKGYSPLAYANLIGNFLAKQVERMSLLARGKPEDLTDEDDEKTKEFTILISMLHAMHTDFKVDQLNEALAAVTKDSPCVCGKHN